MIAPTFTAGDTFTATESGAGWAPYPASAGWVGKLRLIPQAGAGEPIELTAAASGDGFLFTAAAATTATWPAGAYAVVGWVERAGEKYTTATGAQLTIAADPRQAAAAVDLRSLARKTLADLIAARATWAATMGRVRRYKVGDREREFATAKELNEELAFWQGQVNAEDQAARQAAGLAPQNRFLVRFTRPR